MRAVNLPRQCKKSRSSQRPSRPHRPCVVHERRPVNSMLGRIFFGSGGRWNPNCVLSVKPSDVGMQRGAGCRPQLQLADMVRRCNTQAYLLAVKDSKPCQHVSHGSSRMSSNSAIIQRPQPPAVVFSSAAAAAGSGFLRKKSIESGASFEFDKYQAG